MVYPDHNHDYIRIRKNRVDYQGQLKRKRRIILGVIGVLAVLVIALCAIFHVPSRIASSMSKPQKTEGSKDPKSTSSENKEKEQKEKKKKAKKKEKKTTVAFTGDIELSETVQRNFSQGGADAVLDTDLRKVLKKSNISEINNEFSFSTRGEKTANKKYNYRVDPSYVSLYKEIGIDVAGLANNHVLDFGPDALSDTFDTLTGAGIQYMGAGMTPEDARRIVKIKKNKKTFGFISSTHVIPVADWNVDINSPGVSTFYDPSKLLAEIREAKKTCDYVFVCVHWGKEDTSDLEGYQPDLAHQMIDAGADAVIGSHPHVLQGIEFYGGHPIFYSLGDFICEDNIEQSLVPVLKCGKKMTIRIYPSYTERSRTNLAEDERAAEILEELRSLSPNANIDSKGNVSEM